MLTGMTETTVAVSRRRLTMATAAQVAGRVLGSVIGAVTIALLARSMSRPDFGRLALALTIMALASSLGDLGMNEIAVREMARDPHRRGQILGALAIAQLVFGVLLALAAVGLAFTLMAGGQARLMSIFVMATLPLGAINVMTVALRARLRPELAVLPGLVQNLAWLIAVVVVAGVNGGLPLYGVGALIAAVTQSAVSLSLSRRATRVAFIETRRLILQLLRYSWPLGLAGIFVTAYYQLDAVLLFHYRGATPSAYYSAAYRVIDVLQIFPVTVSGVLLPFVAAARRQERGAARAERAFGLATVVLVAVAIPVAVLGAILAPGIVALVYGSGYRGAVLLLRILLPAFVPICLGYVLTSQLIAHDMLRPYIAVTFGGAVVNIAANMIGLPIWGAPVAAWATVGTEFLVMGVIAAIVRSRLGLRLPTGRILRCMGATALTAVAVWFVRSAPLAAAIGVAIVLYPPTLWLSGAISPAELRMLLSRSAAAHA